MNLKRKISNISFKGIYKNFLIASAVWLFFLFSFFLGYFIYSTQTWPHEPLKQTEEYILGHREENTTLTQKILNDLNIKPDRFITKNDFGLNKFKNIKELPLNNRRENPKIYLSKNATEGYRIVYGVFDFEKKLHGAILLDPEGKIKNYWALTQEDSEWESQPDTLMFPHGFVVAPDGSIVTTYDESTSLTKYDYCGNIKWRVQGNFDHVISFNNKKDSIWVSEMNNKSRILKVKYSDGKILRKITMQEIIDNNKEIDVFGLNQNDNDKKSEWIEDPWHFNDIEELSPDLAKNYSLFQAGDLLLSFRNLNLICVIDPETLKVKWWRQGLARRQHDPDWNKNGTITLFNNNMHRGFSNIMEINPETYEHSVPVEGEKYNFYSRIRGKHQFLSNGNFLITSSHQGRVLEINPEGEVVFEFLNLYNKENKEYLFVSEAKLLPLDFFDNLPRCN